MLRERKPLESRIPDIGDDIDRKERRIWLSLPILYMLIILTWAGVFGVRLAGPPNIMDEDQRRPAAYALDVIANNQWLVQRDDTGDITSKPPLYTWLVVFASGIWGGLDNFTLYLPGALSVLALALMIQALGASTFGRLGGFFGAVAYLLSSAGFEQVHLARTDAVFSLAVFVSALLAYQAALGRRSWTWFWLASAIATLTKGPLGLLLAAGGLLGLIGLGSKKTGGENRPVVRQHIIGFALFLLISGGWFFLAWLSAGQPLIDKMIGKELVGHAVESGDGQKPFEGLVKPSLYFLSRFLPWSVFALIGIVRVFTSPSASLENRRMERFLAAYFLFGLALFSIAPHQRWVHQYPLLPAAALLAGCEIVRLLPRRWIFPALRWYPLAAGALLICAGVVYQAVRGPRVERSVLSREAAEYIEEATHSHFPIMHVDSTMAVQYYLGTMRPRITHAQAVEALASDHAAFVLVQDKDDFDKVYWKNPDGIHIIKDWNESGRDYPYMRLLGNRPAMDQYERLVFYQNDFRVATAGARLERMTYNQFEFFPYGEAPRAVITNDAGKRRTVRVGFIEGESKKMKKRRLEPGESAVFTP